MHSARSRSSDESGFSLIEVVVSIGLLATAALGVAQLLALATTANFRAKSQTSTSLLASEKMEQLRGLTWGFDESGLGLPLSDTTSDLSTHPPTNSGQGLNPSPANSLTTNTQGYVDYLDINGQWVGNGLAAPPNGRYVRRWSIQPLPINPNNTLVLQVVVRPIDQDLAVQAAGGTRAPGETRLVSIKSRKAP